MNQWHAEVRVWLKPSVFDPQGAAVEQALHSLGHDGVEGVRIGKCMQLSVRAESEQAAAELVKTVCDQLLCNPVMETYAFTLHPVEGSETAYTPAGAAGGDAR
jgi:phosphoribosylformylglycinamidine synthase PurS subunit